MQGPHSRQLERAELRLRPCLKGTMEEHAEDLWAEFLRTMTWQHVLTEFHDALQHLERYKARHPETTPMPPPVADAFERMVRLYHGIRRVVENPAIYTHPASPEAANLILATVAQVRRTVPTTMEGEVER